MPTLISVTNPVLNEIVVSCPTVQGQQYNRLGASVIEHTSATDTLTGDIFFKFYRCDDSSGSKVYSALDISAAIADSTIENRFLTMLFPQYYQDNAIVTDIGGAYVDIAERLSGVQNPTNPLSTSLSMPSNESNFLEFVGMGVASYAGASYVNGGSVNNPTALWGTRVGQVHLTNVDPLSAPVDAIYDNSDSGCWQFSDFNCDGIIVYTNLSSGSTSQGGLSSWSQMLCVFPILASTLNAQYAVMFNNLDQSFLKSGLGYFDREARIDTFYGWSGNFLQSIFNDWGIPVVSPLWCMSDVALAAFVTFFQQNNQALNCDGIDIQQKGFRFVGPKASNNISNADEKTGRSLLPLLWANECAYATGNCTAITPFETSVQNLGFNTGADYFTQCFGSTTEGYNAHIYRFIQQTTINNTPTNTRAYQFNGVSWSSKWNSQPSLTNVFVNSSANGLFYSPAIDSFYSNTQGSYGAAIKTRLLFNTQLNSVQAMSASQETSVRNWLYTP